MKKNLLSSKVGRVISKRRESPSQRFPPSLTRGKSSSVSLRRRRRASSFQPKKRRGEGL